NEQLEAYQKAEKAEHASKSKSEFLAIMSHEIRTPMNGVLGMAELMQDTKLDNTQQGYLNTNHSSAESLLHVINDILDYSKLEAGKLDIELIPFNLRQVIDDCAAMFRSRADESGVPLRIEIGENTPAFIVSDPSRIRQIIINLLGNAYKFTEQGYILLKVFTAQSQLRFEVEDTGIGLTDEQKERIYAPFTQAEHSTSRKYGGTGLGLSICKRLAELMGGCIGVEDHEGGGSRFFFTVRLQLADDMGTTEHKPQHSAQKELDDYSHLNVLVAEDNSVNQKVIVGMLKKLKIVPTICDNGQIALQAYVDEGPYDLILMDCEMPEMNGYEATRAIRHHESDHANLKRCFIVALSAHAINEKKDIALESGMDDYLTKPVRINDLSSMLRSHFP
ncbi:MAG: ATP-binding protein, partial [Pseudomonadota bacterium]|nr:ATP-binding protein [Pseudomonadota bacterium]